MRVHVLPHAPFEGLGAIEPWLVERGAFHLEMTPASVDAMLAHCGGERAQRTHGLPR